MKDDIAIHSAFEDYQVWDSSRPEKNLLKAILTTALEDLKKGGYHARQARIFFMSENDSYLFSFTSVCDQLGICPKRVRTALSAKYPGQFPSSDVASFSAASGKQVRA